MADNRRKKKLSRSTANDGGTMAMVKSAIAVLTGALPRPSLSRAERERRRTRWGRHVPTLAPLLAEVLDAEPAIFAALGKRGADLRGAAARIHELSGLRAQLLDLEARLADLLLCEKSELHDDCQLLCRELSQLLASRLVDPAVAARLAARATPAMHLLAGRRAAIGKERRRRARLRSGTEKEPGQEIEATAPRALLPGV